METAYERERTDPLPLLSVNDVARCVKRSRTFVYDLVREGELQPIRVGKRMRFRRDELIAYLERHREGAAVP